MFIRIELKDLDFTINARHVFEISFLKDEREVVICFSTGEERHDFECLEIAELYYFALINIISGNQVEYLHPEFTITSL